VSLRPAALAVPVLLAASARAAEPADDSVAERTRGEDLAAWEALETAEPPPDDQALQDFILDHRDSPLAELAYAALRARGPLDPAFVRAHRPLLTDLERSWTTHQDALRVQTTAVAVAPLTADPEQDEPPAPWRLQVHAGGVVDDAGPAGALGLGVGRGAWTGLVRGQLGRTPNAELAVRLQPAVFGVAFVEAAFDARIRGLARAGVSVPLGGSLSLESSMAVAVGQDGLAPVVRLELSYLRRLSDQE